VVGAQNQAEFRLVETGSNVGEKVIITKGVSTGESVITDGHVRLAPNSLVEVKGGPQAPATNAADAKTPAASKAGEKKL